MIDITLRIKDIDYEKTVENLWPVIKMGLFTKSQNYLALRFLHMLNDTPLMLIKGTLKQISENKRGELFCGLTTLYENNLTALINNIIKNNLSGDIVLGDIEAKYSCGETVVTAVNIKVNYKALVKEEAVNRAIMQKLDDFPLLVKKGIMTFIKGIAGMSEDKIEKGFINIANMNVVKNWLLNLMKSVLSDHGIVMAVSGIELSRSSSVIKEHSDLTDFCKYEDELIEAAARYINTVFAESACEK